MSCLGQHGKLTGIPDQPNSMGSALAIS